MKKETILFRTIIQDSFEQIFKDSRIYKSYFLKDQARSIALKFELLDLNDKDICRDNIPMNAVEEKIS